MAIFSRRTLQRLLNENASFLSKSQLKSYVKKLNELDLSFEWEIVLLNVFSKLGTIVHEPKFWSSSRKIDLLFYSQFNEEIEFLSDITTVSDSFAEKENPVGYLSDRLLKIQIKKKLPGGFGFAIGGNTPNDIVLRKKQKLYIPTKKDFDKEIFGSEFKAFINEIVQEPFQERELYIRKDRIQLKIFYSLDRYSFSTFPSYTEIVSLEDNSIWKALIRKYNQLKETKYEGNIGIIVCDGDCSSLKSLTSSWYSKTSSEVIRHFLRKKSKVTFILTVYVNESVDYYEKPKIICKIFRGKYFSQKLEDFFSCFVRNTESLFPVPERTSANAVNFIKAKSLFQENTSLYEGEGFYTGTIKMDEIKVSSRNLLKLLAGKIKYEEIPELQKNFFKRKLNEGKLIDEVEIEKVHEKDDDWIIIRLKKPDVAVSPFEVPDIHK